MFLQTCTKLTFCLTQIYFLAITAWYRLYSMCFPIGRNTILGFRKNMSQRPKWFQGNLDTTSIKNFLDRFRSSLNVRDYCKTFHSGITLCKITISQGWTPQTIMEKALRIFFFFQNIAHVLTLIFPSILVRCQLHDRYLSVRVNGLR